MVQAIKAPSLHLSTFSGTDFGLWRTDAAFILKLNGHWDVITGKFPKPRWDRRGHIRLGPEYVELGTEEDVEDWKNLNDQACALLYSALGPDQRQQVSECT